MNRNQSATELTPNAARPPDHARHELFAEYKAARSLQQKLNASSERPHAESTARSAQSSSLLAGTADDGEESFDVTGAPTTWGIPELRNSQHRAERRRRGSACEPPGANVIGKTNVPLNLGDFPELQRPSYGTTNYPWTPVAPGGSFGRPATGAAPG
jgi:Asp-tRNA(Asn)/Glu-tRNA(Gln) amidotransferase A subunit family amidase